MCFPIIPSFFNMNKIPKAEFYARINFHIPTERGDSGLQITLASQVLYPRLCLKNLGYFYEILLLGCCKKRPNFSTIIMEGVIIIGDLN